MLARIPLALAVGADGPVRTLDDFAAAARTKPGGASVGTPGTGTVAHVALELLRLHHRMDLVHVPFRSGGQAAAEAIAGRMDGVLSTFGELAANDRLRVVAITSAERLPGWPALPTFRERGIDAVAAAWFGLCAPAGLPEPVAARLHREAEEASASPRTAAVLAGLGAPPHSPMTREAVTAFVAAEVARWGEIVRAPIIQPG